MLLNDLQLIFQRDLAALKRELAAYPDEASIWAAAPGRPNSGGVLLRHLCGNLQHFIGATLGRSGYVRDRDAEFTGAPWSRSRLLAELEATEGAIGTVLRELPPSQLELEYPVPLGEIRLATSTWLVHLAVHCGFHLGQVDYHRRTVTGDSASIAPMGVAALVAGAAG